MLSYLFHLHKYFVRDESIITELINNKSFLSVVSKTARSAELLIFGENMQTADTRILVSLFAY